jgi:succinate-semialdehyde dehydrogenase / glutarate-semialdehyde dehydrogenase
MALLSIDPSTGKVIEQYEPHTDAEIDRRIEIATAGARRMREMPIEDRARIVATLAEKLEAAIEPLAQRMTAEMGKPIKDARAEVKKCAVACRWAAETGPRVLADRAVQTEAQKTYVRREPLGPILAIMPWNFPLWQLFRFAAPNVVAGNTVLLKHAGNVTGCSLDIERLFADAGSGVLQALLVEHNEDIGKVIDDRRVAGVTLTGSVRAGRSVGARAGAALKKVVLELGGSDPFIVLPDADLDRAAEVAAAARLVNTGQSCIAAKRFIVHRDVYEGFVDAFVAAMKKRVMGDPRLDTTDLGPIAREDLRDELAGQVRRSVDAGACVALGGQMGAGPGSFYAATVLTDVPPDSVAATEELFGPVASVFRVADEEEAIDRANTSEFGLGASVWSNDLARAESVARHLHVGMAFVNDLVKSDPRIPFGGVKDSGYGRELGEEGMLEFVNAKAVSIR